MEQIPRELREIPAFADLSESDLSAMAAICEPVSFPPRSIVAHEATEASELFILLKGSVTIWVDYGKNSADLLAVRIAPCLVGEMSIADMLPRSATILTDGAVTGYIVKADDFRRLLKERGSISLSLMRSISILVRNTNDTFLSELRKRNKDLSTTNQELRVAQRKLVLQERLSNLGKVSSMIIHDLRNPLSVIKGYADLLIMKHGDSQDETQKYLSQISRETMRLSGLAGELLDYSRGEIQLAHSPVTVEKMFLQLKENLSSRYTAKEIKLTWEFDFKETILVDVDRMLRVLINLIENSVKASVRGGEIFVSARKTEDGTIFLVKDNGSGMSQETKDHIFDPFYSSSEGGGTGLGMHIVKMIVDAHGGSVDVQSEINKGTTIRVKIPL